MGSYCQSWLVVEVIRASSQSRLRLLAVGAKGLCIVDPLTGVIERLPPLDCLTSVDVDKCNTGLFRLSFGSNGT
jgi:hypothetical protein